MPHFECGAFNHSATSPEPETGHKKPRMDGRYVTGRIKTDKGRTAYIAASSNPAAKAMRHTPIIDLIRKELHGVFMTLGLVAILTAVLFALVWQIGLAHGS